MQSPGCGGPGVLGVPGLCLKPEARGRRGRKRGGGGGKEMRRKKRVCREVQRGRENAFVQGPHRDVPPGRFQTGFGAPAWRRVVETYVHYFRGSSSTILWAPGCLLPAPRLVR